MLVCFLIIFLFISGMPVFLCLTQATLSAFNLKDPCDVTYFISMLKLLNNPLLSAIPLFTFTGLLLSNSNASKRLINLTGIIGGNFKSSVIIVCLLSCSFLTALTGASGVTIIALGPLLLPVLLKNGFKEKDAAGFLISTGGLGLLFPPSLPVILYAIIGKLDIDTLFKASLIPGLLAISGIYIFTVYFRKNKLTKQNTNLKFTDKLKVLVKNSYELPLPIIIISGIFTGIINISEAAVISFTYVFILQLFLKEIPFNKKLKNLFIDSMILSGSILIILAAALSFTDFMVDMMIPDTIFRYVENHIKSPLLFLIILNIILLITGCIMDIFSAIIILIPLISPVALKLGINPYHLGVIFITNLEIGYLTPPVGFNLFIGAKTFNKPVLVIYKFLLPYILFLLLILLLITYIPLLSTFLI